MRIRDWSSDVCSSALESLVRRPAGGFFVISETAHWPKSRNRIAIRFDGDPVAAPRRGFRFGLVVPAGFSPSDTTLLPDGRLLVLLRRFELPYTFTIKQIGRASCRERVCQYV